MRPVSSTPRLLVAGLRGGSGKTVVSLGILLLLRRAGIPVRAFKKGPDYIDPAWLSWASGEPTRNLDTYLMGANRVLASFQRNAIHDGLNLIEGNRGLFDGFDAAGTHSSAVLAHAISAPVILILDATKMTRTAAALVLGCQALDPALTIGGVILNNVANQRHERILRTAIESVCSVPVIGALAHHQRSPIAERYLGLVTPQEHETVNLVEEFVLDIVRNRVDIDALLRIAQNAPPLAAAASMDQPEIPDGSGLRIGFIHDSAFTFYYPENLEELRRSGAELLPISALESAALPENLHGLYIGGGFPETHAERISRNTGFLASLRSACAAGLPVYAECGGLMLLARSLLTHHNRFAMAGVFPVDVELFATPQGHGYSELVIESHNPFFAVGTSLRGHEFHYSRLAAGDPPPTAAAVLRGTGCFPGRDCLVAGNVLAGYTHLHATATPEWARGILTAACGFAAKAAASQVVMGD